ncbi:YbhB/YbcL family Raf kinase inhibitor-like protein [Periweissella cryptocerci]|uniref:YbhB/YbcL family Raf kinase inhibitor-like protein n=1 Tax=Periweissella cryptocerci TaxID=2506420 RepID=A0A4P6YRF9_9LACO|nr:YbhB/YbcL family Raf kinase inhibitor-like protein [Periweissella cryptocerci]QBO35227.1 YbhB/YbcL family Raf kinase inhibitor-like protein [Periweissella cryptocerci]
MNNVEKLVGRLMHKRRADFNLALVNRRELITTGKMRFASDSFKDGGIIPFTNRAEKENPNLSPELHWSRVPVGSEQLLIVVEDVDAPFAEPTIHMAAMLDPIMTKIPVGGMIAKNPELDFIAGRKGRIGYFGPRPLAGHGEHRYYFWLIALDKEYQAGEYDSFSALLPDLQGHVLAKNHFIGTAETK